MRVLMLSGQGCPVSGVHQVQQRETADALRHPDVDVSLADSATPPSLPDVDLVHAWWPSRRDAREARTAGIPPVAYTEYMPVHELSVDSGAKVGGRLRMASALPGPA